MNHLKNLSSVSALILISAFAMPANAQYNDEIIVTATKRAESIQDVPVSVSAVSLEKINALGVSDFSELAIYLPNFEINNSTILPNLYVRGLGSGATHSIEQSVGRYVDEVYIGRGAQSIHGFFDVEAVEILRGPQGTLFGKNTVAGAMVVRTANPTDEFEAGVNLTYGGYSTQGDYKEAQGYISGPIADGGLRFRLAGRYKQDDGYYINRLADLGPDTSPDREDFGIRLKLEWDVGENTTMSAKLDHQAIRMVGGDAAELNAVGGPPSHLASLLALSPGFNTDLDFIVDIDCTRNPVAGSEDFCPGREQDTSTASFRIDHDVDGWGTFMSLTAFQTYEFAHRFHGIDSGIANGFRAFRDEEYNSFTQEFRFTSDLINDKFDFIAGAYYENSDIARFQSSDIQFTNLGLLPPGLTLEIQRNEPWSQETETFAAFGQVRYNLTDNLRAILGGRFSTETKDFTFDRFFHEYGTDIPLVLGPGETSGPFGDITPLNASDDRSESRFTPSITLQYDATDDINLYATYSQGHKTGGFSERIDGPGADFDFDRELNDNFELGLKGRFMDGRLKANVAAFHMTVDGLQLASQVPGVIAFSVRNAAQSTVKGIEADAVFNITDQWVIGGDYAFTDATYDEFLGSPDCPDSVRVNGECDLSGFVLNFAPKHKGNAFIDYYNGSAFGDWGFGARGNVAISGEYFTDISYADSSFEDGYTIIGGNVRLVSPDGKYNISLIGKNLTEEVVLQWGIPTGPNSLASLRAHREIAVKFDAKF